LDSSEAREPSYYEVALTNRQVLVAFVVLLTCLLGAFLSGVWVGRGAETAVAAPLPAEPAPEPDEPVEQLSFFGREPGSRTAARPAGSGTGAAGAARSGAPEAAERTPPAAEAPPVAPAEDSAAERMRRTLEAEMAAHREPAPEATPPPAGPESEPLAPGERTRRVPTETATRAAATTPSSPAASTAADEAASPGTGRVWIQVYSSSNGERAREIVAQLRSAGFAVVLSEAPRSGPSGAGAPTYRVRVGPYDLRPRAEKAAQRLRREHRLDTWVTDAP
jgi:cell division septation protein DedD